MDKTISINLGGILFQIDEEAYRILRDYLQSINNYFAHVHGGNETIEDIEARIAEIFQSQKGIAGIISKENVESMITVIGRPEDFGEGEFHVTGKEEKGHGKKMYRNTDDSIIGGVCSGIAAYLDSEPVIFRILFVLFIAFFGIGFLVYIGLWIALPAARTETQKKEMYGSSYHETKEIHTINSPASRFGNALNEIFRAIGRIFFVIFRVVLIMFGVVFVVTGFLLILSFVMIFIFKVPGIFFTDGASINFIDIADFLNYMVSPSTVPWIIILSSIVIILPLLALIYWGVKMIFWFKARDGVVSLVFLVVWVMALAALSIIGFNEGVSFAETGKSSVDLTLPGTPDTLYIKTENKIADLSYEHEFSLPHDQYTVYINNSKKELYIRPELSIEVSDDKRTRLEVIKRSTGRSTYEAEEKSNGLIFNYNMGKDSLVFDEYFRLPGGHRWSADEVSMHLYVREGTIVKFLKVRVPVRSYHHEESDSYYESRWEPGSECHIMTSSGLESIPARSKK